MSHTENIDIDTLSIELAKTAKRLPPIMRIKPFLDQVLPVGNTKFWDLVKQGLLELTYVDGIAFVVVASGLKLIAQSPTKPVSPKIAQRGALSADNK